MALMGVVDAWSPSRTLPEPLVPHQSASYGRAGFCWPRAVKLDCHGVLRAALRRVWLTKVRDGSWPFLAAYDGLSLLWAVEEPAGKVWTALGGLVPRRLVLDGVVQRSVYGTSVQYSVSFSSLRGLGNGRERVCHAKAVRHSDP